MLADALMEQEAAIVGERRGRDRQRRAGIDPVPRQRCVGLPPILDRRFLGSATPGTTSPAGHAVANSGAGRQVRHALPVGRSKHRDRADHVGFAVFLPPPTAGEDRARAIRPLCGADRLYDGAYMPGETAIYLAKMLSADSTR